MQQPNWHDIYTQLSPKLLGICRRYIKDTATAEDIVQDSFIVAIQKEKNLKNKESLNGWLSKIVINRAINHLKNENKFSFSTTENLQLVDEPAMTTSLEIDKKSAILASNFSQTDLLEAIDRLSENHKSVFNMYVIDQFSHLEISTLLKISVGTSKSSLSRARKNIQEFLIEKLNQNKTDEKKKRRLIFFFFLGFGNLLFSQYFRKSFSNFEIQPKNELDLTKKVKPTTHTFVSNSLTAFSYLKIGAAVFAVFGLLFYVMKKETNSISNKKQIIEKKSITTAALKDSAKTKNLKTNTILESKKEISIKNTVATTQKLEPKKTETAVKAKIKKDTTTQQEPSKVVVIRKQIVKKDTVYVPK